MKDEGERATAAGLKELKKLKRIWILTIEVSIDTLISE